MGRVRTAAKWGVWLLGACAVVLVAWFGINATDEPLSDEARAALIVPPLPAPGRDNGFLDHLVLAAPADVQTYEAGLERLKALNNQSSGAMNLPPPPWGDYQRDPRVPRCVSGAAAGERSDLPPCLEAALDPRLPEALRDHATLLGRYRAMRDKRRFVSLFEPKSPEDALPAYVEISDGQRLSLYGAALRFHAGDRAGAVRELEHEAAFYRRMARDATLLIDKMIAFALLDRTALFAVELARRMPRAEAPPWRRLEALLGPLTKEELDVAPPLRREFAHSLQWLQTRRYVRLPDFYYEYSPSGKTRPWWDPVAPYLYRPHQTANKYIAQCRIFLAVAERPSTEFFAAVAAARQKARALEPGPVAGAILNPAGPRHPLFEGCDDADYVGRMHGRAGVQTLARLVVKLRAAGISKPEDVTAALAGPLGQAHPDPFTGKPMRFDPSSGTVGFDILNAHLSGVARELRARYGRMALRL